MSEKGAKGLEDREERNYEAVSLFPTWSPPNLIWALYCWPTGNYCHPHGTVNAVEVLDSCSADAYFTLHTQALKRATQNDRNVSLLILSADRYTFFWTEFPDSASKDSVCSVSVMNKMQGQKKAQMSNSITLKTRRIFWIQFVCLMGPASSFLNVTLTLRVLMKRQEVRPNSEPLSTY